MSEVLVLALSFPSVVFTVLLGVVLVYWAFVMVGVVHIGEGSEGALDGIGDGGFEGATKGLLEGHLDASGAHFAESGDGLDIGEGHAGDAGDLGDAEGAGAVAALVHALHLRSAPATVVLSLIVTFAWLISVTVMQVITRSFANLQGFWLSAATLLASPLLSLPLTSLAVRPLAKVFAPRRALAKADLIGKTCVVRTGSVSDKFGEAILEDGGAGLVIRVRVGAGQRLGRGEHALIVEFDPQRETFLVEPMKGLLADD